MRRGCGQSLFSERCFLAVDEKSQIQALDRTQPGLPIKKGRCGMMTHDYKRNGTTTLFAALETLVGDSRERLRGDRVAALALVASDGNHIEAHLLSERTGDKAAYGV